MTREAFEYAVVSLSTGFSTVPRGQTQYLLSPLRFSAIFPSRAGYIDQSGNPCMPPPHLPNPLSSVTRGLTNQIPEAASLAVAGPGPRVCPAPVNGVCTLAQRQITCNLLPVVAAMAAGGPYTYCGCQRHRLTQHNCPKIPPPYQ